MKTCSVTCRGMILNVQPLHPVVRAGAQEQAEGVGPSEKRY